MQPGWLRRRPCAALLAVVLLLNRPAQLRLAAGVAALPHGQVIDFTQGVDDVDALFCKHAEYQARLLAGPLPSMDSGQSGPPAVLVATNDLVGLGNRIPAIVTAYIMALMTGRLLLVWASFLDFVELPFPAHWPDHSRRWALEDECRVQSYTRLGDSDGAFCGTAEQPLSAPLVRYSSIDYDLPMLQVNPAFKPFFDKFFPDGEVFARAAAHLFRPRPPVLAALAPYADLAARCGVGLHLRTRKYGGVQPLQFAALARALLQGQPPGAGVFVAADEALFGRLREALPGRQVWWSDITEAALTGELRTRGRNPGTELSAVVDMLLLSKCRQLVLTPSSSLGAVAAGLGGITPVLAGFGSHNDSFLNPWFWKSITSEPCFFKAAPMQLSNESAALLMRRHPLFYYHNQCHYQQALRQVPEALQQPRQQAATQAAQPARLPA